MTRGRVELERRELITLNHREAAVKVAHCQIAILTPRVIRNNLLKKRVSESLGESRRESCIGSDPRPSARLSPRLLMRLLARLFAPRSLGSDPMHDSLRDSLRDSFFYAGSNKQRRKE